MSLTRTIEIEDITPTELASLFCEMDDGEQAEFFEHIHQIAAGWAGAGWCQQSYSIAKKLTPKGRDVIRTLAGHALPELTERASVLRAIDSCGGADQPDESDDWNRGYNEALTAAEREVTRVFDAA